MKYIPAFLDWFTNLGWTKQFAVATFIISALSLLGFATSLIGPVVLVGGILIADFLAKES